MDGMKKLAASWCDFINVDRTCALMQALHTETDARCKYYREEESDRCRYFELHILKSGRQERNDRTRLRRKVAN